MSPKKKTDDYMHGENGKFSSCNPNRQANYSCQVMIRIILYFWKCLVMKQLLGTSVRELKGHANYTTYDLWHRTEN